jgi:flagellum-specific peptidoglycan hydrolase FlgJ
MLLTQAVLSDWQLHVPASVSMAQAILESNWGKSAPGFNLFGIKGTGPEGSTLRKVVEYRKGKRYIRVDRFRAYANTDGSMQDHAELLAKGRAYGRARAVSENPEAYTRALQGSYASDPRYAGKLQRLMELYALHRFDWVDRTPLK